MNNIFQTVDLKSEAVLAPSLRPEDLTFEYVSQPSAIFLTGATGFLGAFLLKELLEQTQADIYCLVRRSNTVEAGRKRIFKNLQFYKLWDESLSFRIIPVIGDLSQPYLALDTKQFQAMASKIDSIYHCGALVKWTYPYEELKPVNVLGTQEVLKLACQIKLKPLHFISSLGALAAFASCELIKEKDILDEDRGEVLNWGYLQTKWVAENLVSHARLKGLPVCLYRPYLTAGSSQNGILNTYDLFIAKIIKGCIQLGSAPELNWTIDMTPVDYQSKTIIYLSRQPESLGQNFHPLNPQPIKWEQIVNWIKSFGYEVEQVPYSVWKDRLFEQAKSINDNILYRFVPIFANHKIDELFRQRQWGCQNTLKALADTDIVCPPLDQKYFITLLSYFIRSTFLKAPLFRNKHLPANNST